MTEHAFTVRQIADSLGINASTAKRRASREGWPYEETTGRGGRRRLYPLESLPDEVQVAVLRRFLEESKTPVRTRPAASRVPVDREALWDAFDRKPQSVKDEAARRLKALQLVERLVGQEIGRSRAVQEVAREYGEHRATLYRWLKAVKGYDPADWLAALAPGYSGRTATAECSPEAWEFFKAQYLREEAPSIASCHHWTAEAAKAHGWAWPCERTVARWVQKIPRTLRVLKREGEHAMLRLYPSLQRTVRDLHALYWINGDGYQHNVFVRFPDGTVGRPKTWFWQDIYSRKILAWRTDRTEHSDMIRLALGDVLEHYGIPEHATIDNTRAAANKWLTAGVPTRYRFKVREEDPLGLMPQLGIEVHWTSVHKGKGHGQAKPVERAFGVGGLGEYVDKHPKLLSGAYTGPDVTAKPENYGERAIEWETFVAVLRQAIRAWNAREGRETEICAGQLSFDAAFRDSYQRNAEKIRRATEAQRRMWLLAAESVTVQKDATVALRISKGPHGRNRYSCDALIEYAGRKVVVRFDPDHLHEEVHAYQPDGRYIGAAECILAAGFGDTSAGREWARNQKRRLRAEKERAEAEVRMSAVEAADYLPDPEPEEPVQTNVVRGAWEDRKRAVGSDVQPDDELEEFRQRWQDDVRARADRLLSQQLPIGPQGGDED
ncbi:transposase domain-containing protein [Spiribacter halobius]|uniref:DNA-binding protein n=1 Tax=Sediminicurvatus halobius TaxID=2182432 RepID=A0A2U2N182_9GAMM|nr:transposase domain-containing protein [Spiribacter halobius]PWG62822.1 DNA-binding protein [Spiribacter halobius]UEX77029.1 Mu transposase C-terminal domain-containing protein [Spiribacter halobius]